MMIFRSALLIVILAEIVAVPSLEARVENINSSNSGSGRWEVSVMNAGSNSGLTANYFLKKNLSIGARLAGNRKESQIYSDYNFGMLYRNNVIFDFQTEDRVEKSSQAIIFLRKYFPNPYNFLNESIQFYYLFQIGRDLKGYSIRKDYSYFGYFVESPSGQESQLVTRLSHLSLEHNFNPYYFANLGLGIQFFFGDAPHGFFINFEIGYTHYLNVRERFYAYNDPGRFYLGEPMPVEDLLINRELFRLSNRHDLINFFIIPWFGFRQKF